MDEAGRWEQFLHSPEEATVPRRIRRGSFANVLLVQQVNGEFILDFLTTLIQPNELVRRIVCNQGGLRNIALSLETSMSEYETRFGPIRSVESMLTKPGIIDEIGPAAGNDDSGSPVAEQLGMAAVYKTLRLSADRLVGVYADSLQASFTSREVSLDFIANFYPRSVVVARVLVAASRMPPLLETLLKARDRR